MPGSEFGHDPQSAGLKAAQRLLLFFCLTLLMAMPCQAAAPESLLWDRTFNLRGGFGYKDNVLLSPVSKQGSAFGTAGLDVMLLRFPIDGTQFYFFVTGDDTRYLRDVGTDKEQTLVAVSKLQKEFREKWEASFSAQYLYQNQVLDVSATEADLTTVQLRGHSLKATPALARKLPHKLRLQFEFPVTRQYLREPLDDYWEGGPKISLEREYGRRSLLSLTYALEQRLYDHRRQTDREGARILGTSLEFQQHEFELANRHYWDEERRWRTDSKLALELNRDNAAGYFDYNRYGIIEQIRYTAPTWNVRSSARAYFYDYSTQTASPEDPSRRHLTTLVATLRAEKNLSKSFKLYAQFEHEQSLSNRPFTEYRANTIVTGFDWEF